MKALTRIDFCCNDPDTGAFAGKVTQISYNDCDLEADNWSGYAFNVIGGNISRKYPYRDMREWVGNWCWNSFWFYRDDAKRLLNDLRNSGRWNCTGGPVRLCDWFDKNHPLFSARFEEFPLPATQ